MENLETKTVTELKAMAYDKIAEMETSELRIRKELRVINEEIAKKLNKKDGDVE